MQTSSSTVNSLINGLGLSGAISSLTNSVAHDLGFNDFYALHVLDYCEGSYTPRSVPNVTVKAKDIHQKVARCSKRGSGVNFTPGQAIQETLDKTGTGITLDDLHWNKDIDTGIKTIQILQKVMLAFYCVAIGFAFITTIGAIMSLISPSSGRATSAFTAIVGFLAFLALGIASGLVTAIGVKGDQIIDKYGKVVGISGNRSNKLLALTWAGTALLFLGMLVNCCGICFFGKQRRRTEKHGGYS